MKPSSRHVLPWTLFAPGGRRLVAQRRCPARLDRPPASLGQCRWSSASATDKPYYVTTPIFYVNDSPHLGHLYTMVLADAFKRWQQINGRRAFLCTGTDEHGMKIQQAAARQDMPPRAFCDLYSGRFRDLTAAANVGHDLFMRTTDEDHREVVQGLWRQLKKSLPEGRGLYKGVHKGWYCVSDECFYPESVIEASIVPQTGHKILINTETGNQVEWVEEETWFFPLTKYKDDLLKFYNENPEWITPAFRMVEVRNWVENQLEDLSVTRPASRLSWGISDPDDANITIYVWVDALFNYLTNAGYGSRWHSPKEDTGLWPPDLQIIGKDILRFHGVYWPALLLALGLPLPKRILCHSHWTLANRKMSKSLGNVVNPFTAMQRWDTDPLRYFLMQNGSLGKDMSYSNPLVGASYAKHLQANYGNLVLRIARAKVANAWSTQEAVAAFRRDGFRDFIALHKDDASMACYFGHDALLNRVRADFSKAMQNCSTSAAVAVMFEFLRETNRYVTDAKPWDLVKNTDEQGRTLLNWVVFNAGEAVRIASILLQPFMPTKASDVLDELGVRQDRRTVEYAEMGKDVDYGTPSRVKLSEGRPKIWGTVFPPVPDAEDSDEEVMEQLKTMLWPKTKNKMNQRVELLAMEARMGEEAVAKLLSDAAEAAGMDGAHRTDKTTGKDGTTQRSGESIRVALEGRGA
ncbi:hypothetical protein CDD83_8261 [Cordyceps sp. RAO-2017]|nr:hypothetical protein CDD83_8261 [Cordyceps sp. RAO-2017]